MPGGKLQIWISMFSYFENRKTTYFDFLSLNFTVEMKIKTLFLIFQFIKKNEMALWVHGFFTYCPVNHEYSWKKIQIEKKSEFCFRTCKNRLSVCDGWRASWLFHDGDPYHIETRPLISRTNQWTGFYTTEEFVMKEFMLC